MQYTNKVKMYFRTAFSIIEHIIYIHDPVVSMYMKVCLKFPPGKIISVLKTLGNLKLVHYNELYFLAIVNSWEKLSKFPTSSISPLTTSNMFLSPHHWHSFYQWYQSHPLLLNTIASSQCFFLLDMSFSFNVTGNFCSLKCIFYLNSRMLYY